MSRQTHHESYVAWQARAEYVRRQRARKDTNHRLVHWLTTAPHPTRPAHTHGADDGQVGWRLHLVYGYPTRVHSRFGFPAAICGARPRHGWGCDLFIEEPCARCLAQIEKRRITPPPLFVGR